ncbi:MAG: N-acetylmuramoyl-L-alanine amidase [Armatimonadetes bacterium]|nr:N-acetylmuramoyl-L-alanine amidase [Armatimonadota bacterium]
MRNSYVLPTLLSASLIAHNNCSLESSANTTPPLICIDPGHPSEVNSGKAIKNGTTEVHIDWVVGVKLRSLLVNRGFEVVMTKPREDHLVRNADRALIANKAGAALFVRLHCDAGRSRGFAVYYPDRQGTKGGVTGPSLEVRKQSKRAAESIGAAMSKHLGGALIDGGVRGDSKTLIGSRQGVLTGSIFSKVPVVTVEMVVLTNKTEAEFIKLEAGQWQMARALAEGVAAFVCLNPR